MMQAAVHGRLGRDPETRTTRNGKEMAFASIAVDVTPFGADQEETLWMNVTAFGKSAEFLSRHQKGDLVSLSGKVSMNRWTAANGAEREQLQIVVDSLVSARSVRPGGRKPKGNEGPNDHSASHRAQALADVPFDDPLLF